MKNVFLPFLAVAVAIFSACSTNQDLVGLEEIDDVYYKGGITPKGALVASTTPEQATFMEGATPAEQSYYQNTPYVPAVGEEIEQITDSVEEDYYDEDYARRLENFHSENEHEEYIYDNGYGYEPYVEEQETYPIEDYAAYQASQPQFNWTLGMTYGTYGSGYSLGMSYGMPNAMQPCSCDPFHPNYRWDCCAGYPYPYQAYNSYYMPSQYFGNPYGYGYGYPGYYDPYYGGYPYGYGYAYETPMSRVVNESRGTGGNSSGRTSRGGIVPPPSNSPAGTSGLVTQSQNNRAAVEKPQSRYDRKGASGGSGLQTTNRYSREAALASQSYSRNNSSRTSRNDISPYSRSRQTGVTRTTTSRSTNYTRRPNYSSTTRNSSSNGGSKSIYSPSRGSSSRPSYSPSRGSSTGRSSGGSSPSRSSSSSPRRR